MWPIIDRKQRTKKVKLKCGLYGNTSKILDK